MTSALSAPHFHNEDAAFAYLEARLWPQGAVCPHCGTMDKCSKMEGQATRKGLYKCYACRKQFTVRGGTVFESSHVPLHLWLQAIALVAASKKGVSANALHRILGVTLKTAWFMGHRIREAMNGAGSGPLGGSGQIVEMDETYFGRDSDGEPTVPKSKDHPHKDRRPKRSVIGLVERGGRSKMIHVARADKHTVNKILKEAVVPSSKLNTDESRLYNDATHFVSSHEKVHHSRGEYVRDDNHTNSVEGFFGTFKTGMVGNYHHCSEKHLQRYLDEFNFRYNNRIKLGVNDAVRADNILKGAVGKRLTYRTTAG